MKSTLKLSALALSLVMMFTLCACGGENAAASEPAEPSSVATLEPAESSAAPEEIGEEQSEESGDYVATGVDYVMSVPEMSTFWKSDVATMTYKQSVFDNKQLNFWSKDSQDDKSTVMAQICDYTWQGSAAEYTGKEDREYTKTTIGGYDAYRSVSRTDSDGYTEEFIFVDVGGANIYVYAGYYDQALCDEFIEAVFANWKLSPVA